jgi:hypothetical protein
MASPRDKRYDYIAVGHVTRDVIEDRAGGAVSQPGGGAFYSALQAARLGLRTLIVTQGVPREIRALLEPFGDELDLRIIPAEHTTTLSTRGRGALRSQRLLAWAGPIVEPLTLDAEIVHLAPVADRPASSASRHRGSCAAGKPARNCRWRGWTQGRCWATCRLPSARASRWPATSRLSIWTRKCSPSASARP